MMTRLVTFLAVFIAFQPTVWASFRCDHLIAGLVNKQFRIARVTDGKPLQEIIEEQLGHQALRWFISDVSDTEIVVQATMAEGKLNDFDNEKASPTYNGKSALISIVPTGVGASMGGFAADSAPATSLLAQTMAVQGGVVITNPNAVNASHFNPMANNIVYAEGYMIDQFVKGRVNFYLKRANKIGLIVEQADQQHLDFVSNIVNTARATHGIPIHAVIVTKERIHARAMKNEAGAFVGTVGNPGALLEAADKLVSVGVDAIAITSNVEGLSDAEYSKHFSGNEVNPVGGVEAIITHLTVNQFNVPAAHGPMVNKKPEGLESRVVDPRGAAEYISQCGLHCVLRGLQNAPQLHDTTGSAVDAISLNSVVAIVAPANSLGGIPMLYGDTRGIPIIAVRENTTILNVDAAKLGLKNVIVVQNYAEAAGIISSLNAGRSIESIRRPIEATRIDTLSTEPIILNPQGFRIP